MVCTFNANACINFSKEEVSQKNDTLRVIVKIKNCLPIGWGTKYNCQIVSILKGKLTNIDSTFIMSTSVGSENIFKDIHLLEVGKNYYIEFLRSDRKSSTPYIPAGTTGFMNKKNILWDIIKLNIE